MILKFFKDREPDVILEPGQTLFNENENADRAYIIESGHIELAVRGNELTTLSSGEIVGEMALVDDRARFALAAAGTDGAKLYSLDKDQFLMLIVENPDFAVEVMKVMAKRLREWGELFQ